MNTARMTYRKVNEELFGPDIANLIDMDEDDDRDLEPEPEGEPIPWEDLD